MICGLVRGFKRLLRGMYCKDQVEYSLSIMAGAPVIFAKKKKKKRKELSNDTRESVSSSVEVEVEKTKEKKRLRRKRVEQAGAI